MFQAKPKKERVIRILHQKTKTKNFEKSGLGIFLGKNNFELRPISIPTKLKKLTVVPKKTKLFLDLNNNQYKISGLNAENRWKSGKVVTTTTKLPSKLRVSKRPRGRSYPPHRITQ